MQTRLSRRLQELREIEGLTMQDAARAIGIARSSLHYYESGEKLPGPEALELLAAHYRVSLTELQALADYEALGEQRVRALMDHIPLIKTLLARSLRQLTGEKQDFALWFAQLPEEERLELLSLGAEAAYSRYKASLS